LAGWPADPGALVAPNSARPVDGMPGREFTGKVIEVLMRMDREAAA